MDLMKSIPALLVLILIAGLLSAQRRSKSEATPGDFSYYMLVLSYAPNFCAEPQGQKDPRECGSGRHIGFVVHGLWPQGEDTRGPERCGHGRPVSQSIVQMTLSYIPTPSLIQHEWTSHGTCSGLSSADYFAALRKARDAVKIPAELDQPGQQIQLSPADIEGKLVAANPSYPQEAFRTSCYRDNALEEIRVCLDKNLSPRACGRSAGECRVGSVTMLPVR
jgi:ribonuclease T2